MGVCLEQVVCSRCGATFLRQDDPSMVYWTKPVCQGCRPAPEYTSVHYTPAKSAVEALLRHELEERMRSEIQLRIAEHMFKLGGIAVYDGS